MTRQERYQLIKDFVTRFILEKIEPQGFTYHNLKHTLSVAERAEYLAKKE
jgi:HD superfamily phosphodiesterase